jgi:hypothetical protein
MKRYQYLITEIKNHICAAFKINEKAKTKIIKDLLVLFQMNNVTANDSELLLST